jgi:signal transduction histidine kinase
MNARSSTRAVRDAVLATASVLLGGFVFVQHDAAEQLSPKLLRWEHFQLDDLLLTAALAIAASGWFAMRRWREARASELEKARYVVRLEELSSQLLESEQQQRARFAELLHDEVGQTLFACRLQLERVQQRVGDPQTRRLLDEAHELAGAAMTSTRELTMQISPPILHDLGLTEAIEWLLQRTEQRFGLRARFGPSEAWAQIAPALHEPVFHSVSELVSNAAKHARAQQVEVTAADGGEGHIHVSVRDDGTGFTRHDPPARGFGLFSIERRMACVGAVLRIVSSPEHGTAATLQLPRMLPGR